MTRERPEPPRFTIRHTRPRRGPAARLRAHVESRIAAAGHGGVAARAALLAVLGWFTLRHLADRDFRGIYAGINLALHEAGHLVFGWFGSPWLTAAGGTLFHLFCIAAVGVAFWRQRDVFAVAVAVWWAGTLFVEAAPYAADARARELPLVTVGDGPVGHDWFTMLEPLGLLGADAGVAAVLRTLGVGLLVAGVAGGAWVLERMRAKRVGRA